MIEALVEEYQRVKSLIEKRFCQFRQIGKSQNSEEIFKEFVFCLLTPQSKAKVCWQAVECLSEKGLLWKGSVRQVADCLKGVRFKNSKANHIVKARAEFDEVLEIIFSKKDPSEKREWLVKNVKGMGYKEASHFLRNIGLGESFAILDRHILKNLKKFGVIKEIPASLSRRTYLDIERKFLRLAESIKIPPAHLDLLLWYLETGEVFK